MTPRLLVPHALENAQIGSTLALPVDLDHHLRRVLRRQPGDAVELFDGEGRSALASIEADAPRRATPASPRQGPLRTQARAPTRVVVTALRAIEPAPPLEIVLAQGISAAEKMDWTIEKAVELGVASIVPLQCARSVVRLDEQRAERRIQHWQRLIAAACAQCGRNRLARLQRPAPFGDWIAQACANENSTNAASTLRIHLDPVAEASLPAALSGLSGLSALAESPSRVLLACGPEGGLDAEEKAQLRARGWRSLRLGPRVLRTETAAMTAIAMIQGWLGDLR